MKVGRPRTRVLGSERLAALQTLALGIPIALDTEFLADATCYRVGDARIALMTMRTFLAWKYVVYSDPLRGTVVITSLGRNALRRTIWQSARDADDLAARLAQPAPLEPPKAAPQGRLMRLPAPAVTTPHETPHCIPEALYVIEQAAAARLWRHYLQTRETPPAIHDLQQDKAWLVYSRERDRIMDICDRWPKDSLTYIRKAVARCVSHIPMEGSPPAPRASLQPDPTGPVNAPGPARSFLSKWERVIKETGH